MGLPNNNLPVRGRVVILYSITQADFFVRTPLTDCPYCHCEAFEKSRGNLASDSYDSVSNKRHSFTKKQKEKASESRTLFTFINNFNKVLSTAFA